MRTVATGVASISLVPASTTDEVTMVGALATIGMGTARGTSTGIALGTATGMARGTANGLQTNY